MPQIIRRPGRWIRNCTVFTANPCDSLTQADWNQIQWELTASGLSRVYVLPNFVDGLIASIDSTPNGGLYNSSGGLITTLTYNAGGWWEPVGDVFVAPNTFSYVLIEGISVTLNDGTSCSHDFLQYYQNTIEVPPAIPEWFYTTTELSPSFQILGSSGTVDWGDGTVDSYDATAVQQTLSHTYSGAGTNEINIFNGKDSTLIRILGTAATSATFTDAVAWTTLDLNGIPALTTLVLPSSNTNTIVNFDLAQAGLTGTLDLSFMTGMAGTINCASITGLTGLILPTSSGVITELDFILCDITGTVDASGLTGLGGYIDFGGNNNLTGFTCPSSSQAITKFDFAGCDLASLDVSPLTGLGGAIDLGQNGLMTSFTGGTSSQVITKWDMAASTSLNGNIDLSGYSNLGGNLEFQNSNLVDDIIFPTSSQVIDPLRAYNMNDLIDIDISGLTALEGEIRFSGNDLQTTLTLPASSGTIDSFLLFNNDLGYEDSTGLTFSSSASIQLDNNNMTAAEVNQWLVDLDSNLGAGSGVIDIDGSNAAPDGTSGGYDGLTAKSNLQANGWTVNTN